MSITVNSDWWKSMFDDVYLLTDARSVCNDTITSREVDMVCQLIPIRTDHKILDLCGGHGRHVFEFCDRGFGACTLVDYSQYLIECAAAHALQCSYSIDLIRSDARNTGLSSEYFHHALILGNSLGYIQTPYADAQILSEAYRVLRPGGFLLVDVTDGKAIKASFKPNAWHDIDANTVVCRQRELHGDTIRAREMVLSKEKGLIRDKTYAVRLYEPDTLELLLKRTGFKKIAVITDFSPHLGDGDFGFMNCRMIATGRK